ncbi:MAG: hypothetical protein J5892_01700 [Bacilli bacterium]|nr:hypothetical protein [Bacilli bacterium]
MNNEIEVSVSKLKRRKKFIKITRIVLLLLLLLLVLSYVVMNFIYNNGNFSITLDKNLYFERGIIIYDDPDYKVFRTELYAKPVDYFDNISNKWLPDNLENTNGSHNGENYLAYTFYVENTGTDTSDYWSEIIIDDVIKNVDEAVRIRVYKNGNYITYAKIGINGQAEKDTIPFVRDDLVSFEHRKDFAPGDIDKYTIVIWIEGHDLQCTDNILGGEIKMHMEFNSEFVDIDPKKYEKNID